MLKLRSLRRVIVVMFAAGALLWWWPATPAVADDPNCVMGWVDQGDVLEYQPICDDSGGGGTRECIRTGTVYGDQKVPCTLDYGWWSNSAQCYLSLVVPQPPEGDEVWRGNSPEDGLIYQHTCPFLEGVDGLSYPEWRFDRFVEAGEDPLWAVLEQVVGRMVLSPADIHMAPDPAGAGLVWLPVWMWTPETEETWGPQTDSETVPTFGVTVTVTASADVIWWDMGDGSDPVRCDTPGTPYHPSYGVQSSPDCGHLYEAPSRTQEGGRYTVTATTEWTVDWEFVELGVGGQLERERESSTTVLINELQVLTSY